MSKDALNILIPMIKNIDPDFNVEQLFDSEDARKTLLPLIRKAVPAFIAETFGSVKDPLVDAMADLMKDVFNPKPTAASVNYIDETWMLMNGYIKMSEKYGCTGLLRKEWWEKAE